MTEHADPRAPATLAPGSLLAWLRAHAWIGGWWIGGRAVMLVTAVVVGALAPWDGNGVVRRAGPFGLLGAWDGHWYRLVASSGYLLVPGRQSDPAFFPLYPLLLRGVHATGVGYLAAGVLVSNLAFLGALVALHALTRELLGPDLARRTTRYAAIFPLGYSFSMVYPESLVLCAIAVAALAALSGRWGVATVAGAAAALARPEGLFVALPLLGIAWSRRRRLAPSERGLALGAILAPSAALASFPLYLARVIHDPFAWSRAERAWGRRFTPLGFTTAVARLPEALSRNPWLLRDVVALALYLALFVAARRAGTPWPWLLAALGVVVLPAFSGSFASIGRFGLLAPPVFWGLARLGRGPRADRAIAAACLVLLVSATATIPAVFP